tara:strand:+ start:54 stop:254 length:201 start_codon:yes stop_codon:yes gene_type:complete
MITVEDVKHKMNEPVYEAEVVKSEQQEKKKTPFYKKPVFWLMVIGGGIITWKLSTRGKNGQNKLNY